MGSYERFSGLQAQVRRHQVEWDPESGSSTNLLKSIGVKSRQQQVKKAESEAEVIKPVVARAESDISIFNFVSSPHERSTASVPRQKELVIQESSFQKKANLIYQQSSQKRLSDEPVNRGSDINQ